MVGPLTLGNSVDWNSVRDLPKCSRGIRCLASLKNSRHLVLTWCCSNWDPKIQSIPSEGKGGLLVGGPKNPPTCFFMGSRPWFIPLELTLLHTSLPHLRRFAWVFWWISTILKYTKWSLPPSYLLSCLSNLMNLPRAFYDHRNHSPLLNHSGEVHFHPVFFCINFILLHSHIIAPSSEEGN